MIQRPRFAGPIALAMLLLAGPLFAQEQQPRKVVPFRGSHAFRHLLSLYQLEPLSQISELSAAKPTDTVIILFGDSRPLDEVTKIVGGLKPFLAGGGALLIATDRADEGRLAEFGLSIPGQITFVDANIGYRGYDNCPFLTDSCWIDPKHPLGVNLVQGIATNEPSSINQPRPSPLIPLAVFPLALEHKLGRPRGRISTAPYLFATPAKYKGQGRAAVLAGHGVFMNGMMGQNDNDNFAFASNCIRWLSNEGKRKKVLFIEEGKVQSNFDVPLAELPMPPLRVVNQLLRGLEEENFFNKTLLGWRDRNRWLQWALAGVSGLLFLWLCWRLSRARQHRDPSLALELSATDETTPVLVRRQQAVRRGIYTEAGQALARQCFEACGFGPSHAPPMANGGWLHRRQQEKLLGRLWRLAYSVDPPALDARGFEALAGDLAKVRQWQARGALGSPLPPP